LSSAPSRARNNTVKIGHTAYKRSSAAFSAEETGSSNPPTSPFFTCDIPPTAAFRAALIDIARTEDRRVIDAAPLTEPG
jgi:hypothetical protein